MENSKDAGNTQISVELAKKLFKIYSKNKGIPEKLDSGRMVWTLGLWTPGRLDSG